MIPLPEPVPTPVTVKRLRSLDVFRGMTIAAMLLVNNPGSGKVYWPLEHAEWDGCTPTDLIFPFFLFIVGVSTVFSLAKRTATPNTAKRTLLKHIVIRGMVIILLGLLLHSLPSRREVQASTTQPATQPTTQSIEPATPRNGFWHPSTIRFPGVLQRIGFCYIVAATIILFTPWPVQLISALALMILNGYLMLHVPYGPDHHIGGWTEQDNFAGYIDGKVFGEHNYRRPSTHGYAFDPEGLVSSLPAIATVLFGGLAGAVLRRNEDAGTKLGGMFSLGVVFLAAGYFMERTWLPLNKALWTPTYAVFTAGLAMLTLGVCYWLIDLKGRWKWSYPFIWFGMNAITAFVLAGVVARVLNLVRVNNDTVTLRSYLGTGLNNSLIRLFGENSWFVSPDNLSLAWSLSFVIVFAILMWILYALKIFIKV